MSIPDQINEIINIAIEDIQTVDIHDPAMYIVNALCDSGFVIRRKPCLPAREAKINDAVDSRDPLVR